MRLLYKKSPTFLRANKAQSAILLARVANLFGKAPSDYFLMEEGWFWFQVDLACAVAHWTDENKQFEDSKKHANKESYDVGKELEKYKQSLNNRGR